MRRKSKKGKEVFSQWQQSQIVRLDIHICYDNCFWTFVKTPVIFLAILLHLFSKPNIPQQNIFQRPNILKPRLFSEKKLSETETETLKNWQKFQNQNVTLWFITLFIIILLIIQKVSSGYGQWCLNSLISRGIFQWRRYFVKDHGLHDYWK